MALSATSKRPLGWLPRHLLSPTTNALLPRQQRASLAQIHSPGITSSTETEGEIVSSVEEVPESSRLLKVDPHLRKVLAEARLPQSIQAALVRPLRRKPTHGIPICDLQIRSYNVRSLELFTDFAMRAAYYMNLPARGPVSLPRKVELWTVPRSNFVHKKSQENFNRITVRRLIQIQDGNSETVQKWLAYLVQRGFAGVGMKANIYDWEGLGVSERMDAGAEEALAEFKESWGNFSIRDNEQTAEKVDEFFSAENLEKVPTEAEYYIREPVEISRPKPKK